MPLVMLEPCEALVALLAVEGLFASVRTQVPPDVEGLYKGTWTVWAGKWTLLAVRVLVPHKVLLANEGGVALITLERLLTRVGHVVLAKVPGSLEGFLANPTSVNSSRVHLCVDREDLQALEILLAAVTAIALVGTAVGYVGFELVDVHESLLAEAALEGVVAIVHVVLQGGGGGEGCRAVGAVVRTVLLVHVLTEYLRRFKHLQTEATLEQPARGGVGGAERRE